MGVRELGRGQSNGLASETDQNAGWATIEASNPRIMGCER